MSLTEPFSSRIATFRAGLTGSGIEGALISWAPHIRYFSGIVSEWNPAYLVVDGRDVVAIVPQSADIGSAPEIELQTYFDGTIDEITSPQRNAFVEVARTVENRKISPEHLGIERERLALADVDLFPDLPRAVDIEPLIRRQRMRKDADEVRRIRANLRVLEAGFDAARATIRPGVPELEVWAAMHAAMMAKVGAPFPLQGNFASGPRTLENEPQATNRRFEVGDVAFIDLYPSIDGYTADLTRSFVVGKPSEAQLERHEVLKNALAAGAAELKPGVRARDVDQVVRSGVRNAVGGYTFPHHSGHALGLEGQERPMLIPGDDTIIEPGMVIAIEPGAYLPDTGGMRVEGNYLVTETGCASLSDYPIELFTCG
jgi:Xaa-Pro aminopeptidase